MSIRSIVRQVVDFVGDAIAEPEKPSNSEKGDFVSAVTFEDLKRRYWEQFSVIEKVLQERDQWKDIYKKHVMEHLAAQNMMARSLVLCRTQTAKLLSITNKLLEEKGQKPIKDPVELFPIDGHPADLPDIFARKMIAARALLQSDLDAIAERDRIAIGAPK